VEDEFLWNEESSCIFLFHLLKVGLFETVLAPDLEGNCIKKCCCHEFSGCLGFSHFLGCFGSTRAVEQKEKKMNTLLALATYMMRLG